MKDKKWHDVVQRYGDPQVFIDHLRELSESGDMQASDVQYTLRDVNFIREKGGKNPLSTVEMMEKMV